MSYAIRLTPRFQKKLAIYASLRKRVEKEVDRIIASPYEGTEELGRARRGLDLRGCRSAHVGRNFRIIFVICEECRKEPDCIYCDCEGLPDASVVFLTFGPHEKAYAMQ